MTEPTVPNWIAKAVILFRDSYIPITHWRATRTQVVVQTDHPSYREERFYLDGLRTVGKPRFGAPVLAAADDPRVIAIQRQKLVSGVRVAVHDAWQEHRPTYDDREPEDLARKLTAIQDAVSEALAKLSAVL